jgi:hypothetical protein
LKAISCFRLEDRNIEKLPIIITNRAMKSYNISSSLDHTAQDDITNQLSEREPTYLATRLYYRDHEHMSFYVLFWTFVEPKHLYLFLICFIHKAHTQTHTRETCASLQASITL